MGKSVTYLNDNYLHKSQEDLPEIDPNQEWIKGELVRRAREASGQPGTDQGGYSQVDLRPDWYKTFLKDKGYDKSAPPLTSTPGAVADAVGKAGAAGAQANAERFAGLPGARAQDIMKMQRRAGEMGGLSSALSVFVNKKSNDFDTQQARAVKDASALKKNAKTGVSYNELLGLANLNEQERVHEQRNRKQVEANAATITNADPHSKESQDAQAGIVAADMTDPQTASTLSKEQIKANRTGFQNTQGQRAALDKTDYEHALSEGEKIDAQRRADVSKVRTEQREEDLRNQQAAMPGRRWANDVAPPPAVQTKVRDFVAAQNELKTGAQEMKDIQQQLSQIPGVAGLPPDAVGQYVDKYLGPAQTKALLAKAQLIQQKMVTASRQEDHLGVLQQFEKAMEDSINPTAGTIGAYFRGSAPWDAMVDYYNKYGEQKLKAYGSYDENDPSRPAGSSTLMGSTPEGQVPTYEKPVARRPNPGHSQQQSANAGDYGVQPGDSLGGPQRVPAQAPMGQSAPHDRAGSDNEQSINGTWVVEVNGKRSKPMKLDKQSYQTLVQKYGNANVKQVQ